MGFSKNIKDYFKKRGLTIREVALAMNNHSEFVIGRYMASDKVSGTFITMLKKYFPEINIDELLADDMQILQEPATKYRTRGVELIDEIEQRLSELKKIVSRK